MGSQKAPNKLPIDFLRHNPSSSPNASHRKMSHIDEAKTTW